MNFSGCGCFEDPGFVLLGDSLVVLKIAIAIPLVMEQPYFAPSGLSGTQYSLASHFVDVFLCCQGRNRPRKEVERPGVFVFLAYLFWSSSLLALGVPGLPQNVVRNDDRM